jgi:hypothetical protein
MALAEYAESSPITTGEPVTTDDLEAIALKEAARPNVHCRSPAQSPNTSAS